MAFQSAQVLGVLEVVYSRISGDWLSIKLSSFIPFVIVCKILIIYLLDQWKVE